MWRTGKNEQEALEMIRAKRQSIDPNIGFIGQLMSLSDKFRRLKMQSNVRPASTKQQIQKKIVSLNPNAPFMKDFI